MITQESPSATPTATIGATPSPTASVGPYAGGYTYDESNWQAIGPWFAAFIFAAVFAPLCWIILTRILKDTWADA